MGDVVAELHVFDALRHEQCDGARRPPGLASTAENSQPGGDFEASLKTNDSLDVSAVLATKRRFDVTTDLFQRRGNRFDVGVAQVRVLSYFCDGNGASHPNWSSGDARKPGAGD
jgi:hypothetical protein